MHMALIGLDVVGSLIQVRAVGEDTDGVPDEFPGESWVLSKCGVCMCVRPSALWFEEMELRLINM
jgi:hypothetical protein